ncbi:hypothetical protein MKX01_005796 [Papaver californicum]|nr:hypothetical protein MKX01_005796 [Papaver californicum]
MTTLDKPKHAEGEDNEEHKSGFLGKVKGFIHDVGDKIEEKVGFGKPTTDIKAIQIVSIDLKRAELRVEIFITNPNPVPIPLVDINYLIESDGRKLVSGLIPDKGTIHSHGSETILLYILLPIHQIRYKSTYNDINPGSIIPYKVRVELIVDVPVIGRSTLPMEKTGEIPVPYSQKLNWRRYGLVSFHLRRQNDFDLGLNILEYEVWLGGTNTGGARPSKSAKIEKKGQGIVEVPISFRPKDFESAMWEMLRGRGTGYSMKGNIDVDTIFGPMKLPFEKEGGRTRLKKEHDKDDDEFD